jgi:hypothetical protein
MLPNSSNSTFAEGSQKLRLHAVQLMDQIHQSKEYVSQIIALVKVPPPAKNDQTIRSK